jgi:hypothetical protein
MKTRRLSEAEVEKLNSLPSIKLFPSEFKRATIHTFCEYAKSPTGGNGLISNGKISKNEVIMHADGEKLNQPINYSLQISESLHTLGPGGLDHTCDKPNCGVDPKTSNIVSLVDIKPNDFLVFNYLTTEWDMDSPFTCKCGSYKCYGRISGFKNLKMPDQKQLVRVLPISNFIKSKISV